MSECEHNDFRTLCWKDSFGTDREYEMAFGYDPDGEPTAALMWEDESCGHPISIPITVMLEAICTGWGDIGDNLLNMLAQFVSSGDKIPAFMPGDPNLN